MFEHALICTNFDDGLYRLASFVRDLSIAGLKKVTFIHAVPILEDREIPRVDDERVHAAKQRLSGALDKSCESIDVQIDVQAAKPSDYILRSVSHHHPDVLILGTPSRSRLSEQLFGSTTQSVCRHLEVPVMILRPQLISTYMNQELALRCRNLFNYFLIPYDDSHSANYLIGVLKEGIQKSDSKALKQCLLCWVIEEGRSRDLRNAVDYQLQEAEISVRAIKSDFESLGLEAQAIVLKGTILSQIMQLAVDNDISAIAISSDSMGKLIEWSIPSFAGELMRQSWHPVIYFPPKRK